MKFRAHLAPTLPALIATLLLAACGGGNDQDAGSQTAFNIAPTTITLGGDGVNCGSGYASRVYAYGGAGPYKVYNTAPDAIVLSKTLVDRPGDFFDVTVLAGFCLTNATIVVVDALGRQVTFTVNSTKGTTTGGST